MKKSSLHSVTIPNYPMSGRLTPGIAMKMLACILGFLLTLPSYAQEVKNDSLYAVWSDTSGADLDRLDAFYTRFRPYRLTLAPLSGQWGPHALEAIDLAMKYQKTEYLGLLNKILAYYQSDILGDWDAGCASFRRSFGQLMNQRDYYHARYSLTNLVRHACKGYEPENIDSVLNILEQELDYSTFRILKAGIASTHMQRHFQQNEFPAALVLSQEVIQHYRDVHDEDSTWLMMALVTSADIHNQIGNYQEAEKYARQLVYIGRLTDDHNFIGSGYTQLAISFMHRNDEATARLYTDSSMYIMKYKKECELCYNISRILSAELNRQAGRHEEALVEARELRTYFEQIGASVPIPRAMNTTIMVESGALLGLERYSEAISAAERMVLPGQFISVETAEIHNVIYQAAEKLGDLRKALDNYKLYMQMQDTLASMRNSEEVTRLELEHQYEQQRLIDKLRFEQRQRNTRNLMIGLGLALLLLAMTMYHRLRLIRRTGSALKQKNAIIEAEKEKAKASERAKHQFLANMSHEIRTPMNAIKGMTDILLRRDPQPEQQEYLDGIRQSSDAMLVIINDILDLSKIEAGKIELEQIPFAVAEVLDNVVTIMRFKAEEKGLVIHTDIPDELSSVEGDPSRLQQVLLNLVGNAIKFTEKGSISLSVRETPLTDQQTQLHFTVADTGVGIDPDRLDRIFENFQQAYTDTSRKYGGSGLGLSISKKLVELQGGEIWVESEHGKGSQFHVTVPYTIAVDPIEATALAAPGASNDFARRLQGIRILLVEDNHFNAMVAREELEDAIEDVVVDVAENGSIALEMLRADAYDVILMDVQMPVMNGYEATRAIRSMKNGVVDVPIIAMTANVLKEEVDQCYAVGMNDFIGKPFEVDDLLQKIGNLHLNSKD
ncbi:MAG: ATP-binding protein [Saprospiraceae bacterium]|nr:ATP-binding protein [Saprospiraceae bacterium]